MTYRTLLLGGLIVALGACTDQPTAVDDREAPSLESVTTIRDDVVGVSLGVPADWTVTRDPVLFDESYGFVVWSADRDPSADGPHDREPIARIALVRDATPDGIEALVQAQIDNDRELRPTRSRVEVGAGIPGVAVTGLSGTRPYSVVYAPSGDRVYEIGLWTDTPGLDARAHMLLASLRLSEPTRSVRSLALRTEHEALRWEPSGEIALRNAAAHAERKHRATPDVGAGVFEVGPQARRADSAHVGASPAVSSSTSAACGIWAPYGTQMQWQTQWDNSNTFYSGGFYNYGSGYRGWTAMSGNGGSWWGQRFHKYCDEPSLHNQHFANDWPAQWGANVYSHFSGTVRYAGWAKGGHYTLGRIVIVRAGKWSSLSAHLNGIPSWIYRGASVDAPWTVIGYAGNSDQDPNIYWDPHIHSRVTSEEWYNGYGMPVGGHTVRPRAFRCYACTDPDEVTPDGRKWYTGFYHGRWMKY